MAEADTALGKFSQQYGDRAFTVEPAEGGYVFVRADHVDVDASGCLLIYGHTPERDGGMLLAALGQGQWNSIWVCDPASNTPLALVGNSTRSRSAIERTMAASRSELISPWGRPAGVSSRTLPGGLHPLAGNRTGLCAAATWAVRTVG